MRRIYFLSSILVYCFFTYSLMAQLVQELAYDDGNPNLTLQFNVSAGNVFATKFTPPIIPSQVLSVIYYVPELTGSDYFILEIYDEGDQEPGRLIYGPYELNAQQVGWNEIDLESQRIIVNSDFYVVLKDNGHSLLKIGAEDRDPLSGRTYNTDG